MYRKKSLILKVYRKIIRSKDLAFVLSDFYLFSKDDDQIIRALRKLSKDKVLIKIGKGAYAKAKLSKYTNNYIVSGGLIEAGKQALKKFGIKIYSTQAQEQYNKGLTTQVPNGRVVGIKQRVSRNISFNGIKLIYERV